MPRRRRGRPPIRDGEQSSSLNVRLPHSQFDDVFKLSRRWHVTLPEAVRIKLNAQELTDNDWYELISSHEKARVVRDEAKVILEKTEKMFEEERAIREEAGRMFQNVKDMFCLLLTARSLSEVHKISEHALEILNDSL